MESYDVIRLSEIHFNVPSQTSLLVQRGTRDITSEREIKSGQLIDNWSSRKHEFLLEIKKEFDSLLKRIGRSTMKM